MDLVFRVGLNLGVDLTLICTRKSHKSVSEGFESVFDGPHTYLVLVHFLLRLTGLLSGNEFFELLLALLALLGR
jgi:hypothetical protein